MRTVGQQGGRMLPVGDGMGATHEVWAVMSPARAAGMLPIKTVPDPLEIMPGPPGTQPGSMQGIVVSIMRAAGMLLINTVGCPLMIIKGRAGCGTGVGDGAGGWIGAWQCGAGWRTWSVIRAAGCPMLAHSVSAPDACPGMSGV